MRCKQRGLITKEKNNNKYLLKLALVELSVLYSSFIQYGICHSSLCIYVLLHIQKYKVIQRNKHGQ